jgi:CopG family transcriptional regulator/antitoxin EndoAI
MCKIQLSKSNKPTKQMSKRINVILPDKTVEALDHVAGKGARSRFIDRAVRQFIETAGRANLREQLRREAIANAARDLAMAADWFPLEEEAALRAEGRIKKSPRRGS